MRLKPLGSRVVLQYQEAEEKTQSGIILPDSAKEKPLAVVVAVGPGNEPDGKDMQVKVGDKVICTQYGGTKIEVDGEEFTIIDQNDIMAIVE